MKKSNSWIKNRHKVIYSLICWILNTYTKTAYHFKPERFFEIKNRPYLIVFNHQTACDQFFITESCRTPVYFVVSEDLFSNGMLGPVLKYTCAPIPIKKNATDLQAVKNCLKVAREGGSIALAPEGNRTFSGQTVNIKPSIVKLAKATKLPVAIYKIEGGYGVHPRWSDSIRKGYIKAGVTKIIEPEEYNKLSDEEFYDLIKESLYVDERLISGSYQGNHLAEYMERCMYVCPECGLSVFESNGNRITCKTCGKSMTYLPEKKLVSDEFNLQFDNSTDWYNYQENFINSLDLDFFMNNKDTLLYEDIAKMSIVTPYKRKQVISKNASLKLYGNHIEISGIKENLTFTFDEIHFISVLGRNKMNIYTDSNIYQFKGSKRFNPVKYMNLCYRYKNITGGEENAKFLGL